jgi:hypothetical protein
MSADDGSGCEFSHGGGQESFSQGKRRNLFRCAASSYATLLKIKRVTTVPDIAMT